MPYRCRSSAPSLWQSFDLQVMRKGTVKNIIKRIFDTKVNNIDSELSPKKNGFG